MSDYSKYARTQSILRGVGETRSFYSSLFQSSTSSMNSAFVDLANITLPKDIKSLYPLLEYYGTMDNCIAPSIQKVSLYPLMPIDYSEIKNDDLRKNCKDFLEDTLNIYETLSIMSLNYNVYGFAPVSISFPFQRIFTCRKCQKSVHSDFVLDFRFEGYSFYFKCPHCGDSSLEKDYSDTKRKDKARVKFITWRPHDINFIYSQFTGEYQFFYTPPEELISQVRTGNKFILDRTPKFILEALKSKSRILFKEGEIFAMFRPHFARQNSFAPEGLSLILNVLPAAYLKKVYSKASEVSGVLKASPASLVYPETNPGLGQQGNPLMSVPMDSFSEYMREEIMRHRKDPGYIMISPTPVGQQNLFGDAKQFHYFQEMQFQEKDILQGMGIPREFIEGGLAFNLSSIPARILQNQLQKQINELHRFLKWAKDKISCVFPLGENTIKMKPFRMADDLQLLQMQLQAAAQGDLSKRRIWEGLLDIDYEDEMAAVVEEDILKYRSVKARAIADTTAQLSAVQIQRNFEAEQRVNEQRMSILAQTNNPSEVHVQQMGQQAEMLANQTAQMKMMLQESQARAIDLERKLFQQTRLYEKERLERNKMIFQQERSEIDKAKESLKSQASGADDENILLKTETSLFDKNPLTIEGEMTPAARAQQFASMLMSPSASDEFIIDVLDRLSSDSWGLYHSVVRMIVNEPTVPQDKFDLFLSHFQQKSSELNEREQEEKKELENKEQELIQKEQQMKMEEQMRKLQQQYEDKIRELDMKMKEFDFNAKQREAEVDFEMKQKDAEFSLQEQQRETQSYLEQQQRESEFQQKENEFNLKSEINSHQAEVETTTRQKEMELENERARQQMEDEKKMGDFSSQMEKKEKDSSDSQKMVSFQDKLKKQLESKNKKEKKKEDK